MFIIKPYLLHYETLINVSTYNCLALCMHQQSACYYIINALIMSKVIIYFSLYVRLNKL